MKKSVVDRSLFKYGVEIETVVSNGSYLSDTDSADVMGIGNGLNDWILSGDGSISYGDDESGVEAKSTILTDNEVMESVALACRELNGEGAYTNRSCGLHVHISHPMLDDIRKVYRVMRVYRYYQHFLNYMLPDSRLSNQYCGMDSPDILNPNVNCGKNSRYYAVNPLAFAEHGTVEFRQHGGTTDAKKIQMWIDICRNITTIALDGSRYNKLRAQMKTTQAREVLRGRHYFVPQRFIAQTFTASQVMEFVDNVLTSEKLKAYYAERTAHFAREGHDILSPIPQDVAEVKKRIDDYMARTQKKFEKIIVTTEPIENVLVLNAGGYLEGDSTCAE